MLILIFHFFTFSQRPKLKKNLTDDVALHIRILILKSPVHVYKNRKYIYTE